MYVLDVITMYICTKETLHDRPQNNLEENLHKFNPPFSLELTFKAQVKSVWAWF